MNTTATASVSRPTSMRTRLIAGAVIFAGIAGATLAFSGVASASTVVINANTQQAAAADAMSKFGTATNRSFTPEADPLYQSTGWSVPANTGAQTNDGAPGTTPIQSEWTFGTTDSSSWSLGGEVDLSAGGGVGFANVTVSLDLTASHTWGTQKTDEVSIDGLVKPGETQWVLESTSEATYSGDYKFTAADGTAYEVDNVTITTPVGPKGNPEAATNYRVVQSTNTQIEKALGLSASANLNAKQLTPTQLNLISHQLGMTK